MTHELRGLDDARGVAEREDPRRERVDVHERQMDAEAGGDYDLAALGGLPMDAPGVED